MTSKTQRKIEEEYIPKKHYEAKPPKTDLRIVRTCLNLSCERTFTAPHRFIRLCEYCKGN